MDRGAIMDSEEMRRALMRIGYEIIERNKGTDSLAVIGVYTRGVHLGNRIAANIRAVTGEDLPVGMLDPAPFRDDREQSGDTAGRTKVDFDVRDRKVILVDDVIFTGRTARASIDALMSLGRPRSIQLAVLIDRGHRELPIRADYVGKNVPTKRSELIKVRVDEEDAEDMVVISEGRDC